MKTLTAIFRFTKNETLQSMVRECKTKAQFTEDLRKSGFVVVAVLTDEDIKKYQAMSETDAIYKGRNATVVREYCQQVFY